MIHSLTIPHVPMSFTALLRPIRAAPTAAAAPLRLHLRAMSSTSPAAPEKLVLSSRSPSNHVAVLTLNRPKAKNALSSPLFEDLNAELEKADRDDSVRAIVITGGDKVFAAGADIKEMKDKTCECEGGLTRATSQANERGKLTV